MMKKQWIALLCAAVLILGMADALAGYNELVVCTDGKGIPVYTQSSGGKRAGVLYNGYWDELSLEAANGLYECSLTADYAVWLDEDKAGKLMPESFYYDDSQVPYDQLPCDIFLAEVTRENAPFYTTPGHKTLTARHALGTLVFVLGEFGNDYFVGFAGDLDRRGFMPKAALQKYADLTFCQANYSRETLGLSDVRKATVHTQGGPIAAAASATGYTGIGPTVLENGQEVTVLRERDGWAQLSGGCFLESRFLDPEGDHAVSYATVKTSGPLNRLNVRGYPSTDAWVAVKLCAGAQVQLASHTDDWAAVFIVGPGGGVENSGSVQMQYLAMGDAADKVKSGCVRVRLAENVYNQWKGDRGFAPHVDTNFAEQKTLPAGTEVTVLGVDAGYDVSQDDCDLFLCQTDDGLTVTVWNDGGILIPVEESPSYKVKAASDVKMRATPSTKAQVLRTVPKGAKVEALLRGEGWTMVRYKNQTGYILSRYLKFP